MATKEDYRTPIIDNILCVVEYADSLEMLKKYLAEAATLPYYARAHIADHIQEDFTKRASNLNTNMNSYKLKLMADMDVERLRFVIDTLGKQTALPVRIFAYKTLGEESPASDSLGTRVETPVLALCATAKIMHELVYSTALKDAVGDFDRTKPEGFSALAARIQQLPELTRLFIAERLQDAFVEDKNEIIKRGLEEKRKIAQERPLDHWSCTVNARVLDLIVRIKGEATPLFIKQLARNLAPFQDERNKDVRMYIELFLNAFEITEDGIDPVATQETECRDTLQEHLSQLRKIAPKNTSLKPKN